MSLRKFTASTVMTFIFTGLFSCVTINIYFPAEEVEKAAERIVGDIRQQEEQDQPAEQPGKTSQSLSFPRCSLELLFMTPSAYAQSETTVSNAAIRSLKNRMKSRRSTLLPFYKQGVIRENNGGYVDLANAGSLDMKTRAQVQRLVNAENQDRRQLYLEVARALNIDPSQVDRIGSIFAREWQK